MFRSKRACGTAAACLLMTLLITVFICPPVSTAAMMLMSPASDGLGLDVIVPPKRDVSPNVQARLSQCEGTTNSGAQPVAVTSARVPILMYHHVRHIDFSKSA